MNALSVRKYRNFITGEIYLKLVILKVRVCDIGEQRSAHI